MSGDRFIRFPNTAWTRIKQASNNQTTALNSFINAYREPVKKFIIRQGAKEDDAEDLAQDVFVRIFQHNLLDIADRNKGRFRSFILAITKSVISNWRKKMDAEKRGGGKPVVSLDAPVSSTDDTKLAEMLTAPQQDEQFDSLWMETIFRRALQQLKDECEQKKLPYHEAYTRYIDETDTSYDKVAEQMKVNNNQVRHYIERAKKKIVGYIRSEIAEYCSSTEEFSDELSYLSKFLSNDE